MRKGWEIAIRDTSNGHYRRFRLSRAAFILVACVVIVLFAGFSRLGHSLVSYHRLASEREFLQEKLNERNTQLRFFAERMSDVRAELASIRRLGQSVEHKLGRGEEFLEVGLGGPVREVANQNAKMSTYLNYEDEFLEGMWREVEELEAESRFELDRTVLLSRFLDTRSGLISALPSLRPLQGGYISSHFGRRRDPFSGAIKMHTGLDIAHSSTVPIYATADGVVCQITRSPTYGKLISLYHGYGVSTLYAHLSRQDVKTGDRVVRGQQIGLLGSTGRSTHRHLHYEVRIEGRPVNPFFFLPEAHIE